MAEWRLAGAIGGRGFVLALALFAAGPAGAQAAARSGRATVQQLAWLGGCWTSRTGERVVEEQWMPPRGGIMLGMARTVRGATLADFEHTRITERDGRLVFTATPSGQGTAEFVSETVTDSSATFANPAHDFPQRIVYRRRGGDSLMVRIEGEREGRTRGVDFLFGRQHCG